MGFFFFGFLDKNSRVPESHPSLCIDSMATQALKVKTLTEILAEKRTQGSSAAAAAAAGAVISQAGGRGHAASAIPIRVGDVSAGFCTVAEEEDSNTTAATPAAFGGGKDVAIAESLFLRPSVRWSNGFFLMKC